jgi:hypothetical protein
MEPGGGGRGFKQPDPLSDSFSLRLPPESLHEIGKRINKLLSQTAGFDFKDSLLYSRAIWAIEQLFINF